MNNLDLVHYGPARKLETKLLHPGPTSDVYSRYYDKLITYLITIKSQWGQIQNDATGQFSDRCRILQNGEISTRQKGTKGT